MAAFADVQDMELQILRDTDLIQSFVTNAPHMMWFLGAGTSRTAGMPTATDFIWELKRNYYCLQENQDIRKHDINNGASVPSPRRITHSLLQRR